MKSLSIFSSVHLLLFMLLAPFCLTATEVNFEVVGYQGFENAQQQNRVLVDGSGNLYSVILTNHGSIYTQKYDSVTKTWNVYGPRDAISYESRLDAAISPGGTIYIVTNDPETSGVLLYQLKNGQLTNLGLIPNARDNPQIAVMPDGTPFISYMRDDSDAGVSYYAQSNFHKAGTAYLGRTSFTDLAVSPQCNLYLATGLGRGRVARWSGAGWIFIDSSVTTDDNLQWPQIAVDGNERIYFSYKNTAELVAVLKYNGDDFIPMQEGYLNSFLTTGFSMTVDNGGKAFIAMNSGSYVEVFHHDGLSW